MSIREAYISDIRQLQKLAGLFYMPAYAHIHTEEQNKFSLGQMYSTDSLTEQFEKQHSRFFILSDNGSDRAYAAIYPMGDSTWMLDKIYVHPECKGMGYGGTLLKHLLKLISDIEKTTFTVELHVNRRNDAVGFYRKYGFDVTDEWDITIADGKWTMDGYTMRGVFSAATEE